MTVQNIGWNFYFSWCFVSGGLVFWLAGSLTAWRLVLHPLSLCILSTNPLTLSWFFHRICGFIDFLPISLYFPKYINHGMAHQSKWNGSHKVFKPYLNADLSLSGSPKTKSSMKYRQFYYNNNSGFICIIWCSAMQCDSFVVAAASPVCCDACVSFHVVKIIQRPCYKLILCSNSSWKLVEI